MAEKDGDKKTLYHYTSPKNAEKIKQDGAIKPSADGAFGGGKVYLTSVPPEAGRRAVAINNYDGMSAHWQGRENRGDVNAVVKVEVDRSKVTKEKDPQGRSIYTHKGTLKLDD